MAKINGIEGLTGETIQSEIARGGKFVVFPYCISIIFMSFRRSSDIYFIRAGESAFAKAWPFALISLFMGWWGLPWGLIWTPIALFQALAGGNNVTGEVIASMYVVGSSPDSGYNGYDSASGSPRPPVVQQPPVQQPAGQQPPVIQPPVVQDTAQKNPWSS